MTGDTPIVLFGYYNPIYVYPREQFLDDAVAAGADGLLVVDVPPEADEELCLPALERGLNFIRLATPTTDDKRLPAVLRNTSGFLYYVSIAGITGAAAPIPSRYTQGCSFQETHKIFPLRWDLASGPRSRRRPIAQGADGVVIGSAWLRDKKIPWMPGAGLCKTAPRS